MFLLYATLVTIYLPSPAGLCLVTSPAVQQCLEHVAHRRVAGRDASKPEIVFLQMLPALEATSVYLHDRDGARRQERRSRRR